MWVLSPEYVPVIVTGPVVVGAVYVIGQALALVLTVVNVQVALEK